MKIFCSFLLLLSVSQVVALGRMPSEVHHLKSVGNKLVKIFVTEDTDSEYHIVKTNDIKRLVGSGKEGGCYTTKAKEKDTRYFKHAVNMSL